MQLHPTASALRRELKGSGRVPRPTHKHRSLGYTYRSPRLASSNPPPGHTGPAGSRAVRYSKTVALLTAPPILDLRRAKNTVRARRQSAPIATHGVKAATLAAPPFLSPTPWC